MAQSQLIGSKNDQF